MRTRPVWAFLTIGVMAAWPIALDAQEPTRTDSLEVEVRRLRAELDSLQRVLEELIRQQRDTTEAVDELARLRAAAQAAADAAQEPPPEDQGSRTGNLSILNPEISLTGDIVGSYVAPAGTGNSAGAVPREFEFSFQAALDPYTRTKVFVTHEEEFEIAGLSEEDAGEEEEGHGPEIEEGYLYWVGLPGGIGVKAGKFRQEIGLYNRWHTHALFEIERPLAASTFLGEDGLIQTGVALTLPSVTAGPSTQTITAEATLGNNDALFDGGGQFSYLGRLQSFWDVGPGTYVQLGATGVYGRNSDVDLKTRLLGLDFAFRWAPPSQALYRDLQIKGEWMFAERREAGRPNRGNGGYGQVNFKFTRQWTVGTRVDYVTPYDDTEPSILQIAPSISWWQSEWVRLRAQYNLVRARGGPTNHTFLIQVVWAVGPHKHATY